MKKASIQKKRCRRGLGVLAAGLVATTGYAALPTDGTYAVLTAKDYNADSVFSSASKRRFFRPEP